MGFEERVEFLVCGHGLAVKYPPLTLVDHAPAERCDLGDLVAQRLQFERVQQLGAPHGAGLARHRFGFLDHLRGDGDQIAILACQAPGALRSLPHPADLLHAALGAARPARECRAGCWREIADVLHQTAQHPHRIPQQTTVAGIANVGLNHGGVQPQLVDILQAHPHGRGHNGLIDPAQRGGLEAHEGVVEGVMARHRRAIKAGELAQREPVGDAFGELSVVPVLGPHQHKGAQHLLGVQAAAPTPCVLERAAQIAMDRRHQLAVPIEEVADLLQQRLEPDSAPDFQVCKADLRARDLPHPPPPHIALPDTRRHNNCVAKIQRAVDLLEIATFWVTP
ncbi:MAG TPA: hypothetical protein VMW56_19955 [Candidatus Margulisiibacteriota bacterium]|nr:hypothetical protein [Candidatus Margulisiibacteriota bacterium]